MKHQWGKPRITKNAWLARYCLRRRCNAVWEQGTEEPQECKGKTK
ncbi:hypothetical protein SEA_SWEATNTEARS_47 [Gordonia phage SweatNTears]|nr:hypothetical protein SEA_SWEATNTEARS_47 [Gordonia phage SweatNTears]